MGYGKGETGQFRSQSFGKLEAAISSKLRFPQYPISTAIEPVRAAFSSGKDIVLTAETGSGKTTVLPLEIFDDDWLGGLDIVILEPRRLSAVAAAQRMAESLSEKPGDRIGWIISLDRKVGPRTKITVMTEGILLQKLRKDPGLKEIGLVLFDEFHERTVLGELAFTLCRDVQKYLRPELRIGILSATLDSESLIDSFKNFQKIHSPGRSFPVSVEYRPPSDPQRWMAHVVDSVKEAWSATPGDILVFLPGWKEISAIGRDLENLANSKGEKIDRLHSSIDWARQTEILKPSRNGQRKTILASSIAETSLTIPGVTLVIDAGWSRLLDFDVRRGLNQLVTVRVSQASANQRSGRAGRTQPGTCWRLWSSSERLADQTSPEIERSELSSVVLECAAWGTPSKENLEWITVPPSSAWSKAQELLTELGAIDSAGAITQHGRAMLNVGFEPRWAHMILTANEHRHLAVAISAILQEKDFLGDSQNLELSTRLEILLGASEIVNRKELERVREVYRKGLASLGIDEISFLLTDEIKHIVAKLLASTYPDRIAKKVEDSAFQLPSGRHVHVKGDLGRCDFLVIPDLDAGTTRGQAYLAQEIDRETVETLYGDKMKSVEDWEWDGWKPRRIVRKKWGEIVWSSAYQNWKSASQSFSTALQRRISEKTLESLPWSDASRQFLNRIRFWCRCKKQQDLLFWSDDELSTTVGLWLAPFVLEAGILDEKTMEKALRERCDWKDLQAFERDTPTSWTAPSGLKKTVLYTNEEPQIEVKLQEVFGLTQSPQIAGVRVQMILLSPSQRPLQVTSDLESFWKNGYAEVRKEMRGRYPKHPWPEDPWNAVATNRTKNALSSPKE